MPIANRISIVYYEGDSILKKILIEVDSLIGLIVITPNRSPPAIKGKDPDLYFKDTLEPRKLN